MKTLKILISIFLTIFLTTHCDMENIIPDVNLLENSTIVKTNTGNNKNGTSVAHSMANGSVEFIWKGGDKGSEMGNKPENLLAFFDFNAYQGSNANPKGEITYLIKEDDYTLHREIKAVVIDAFIDVDLKKGWFIGQVVTDSNGCKGAPGGGHDTNCTDDHGDGSSCSDTDHDGGCSHDDTGDTHDDGCSHDDTDDTHDDGCTEHKSDKTTGNTETNKEGNPLSGKNCRIGQLIVVKVHDQGSPRLNLDGLTWKWFDPNAAFVPSIANISSWPHLCKKTIIKGDIVVQWLTRY